MKVRQNDETYSTITFETKETSPVLAERIGGVTKYTPLVLDNQEVEIDGYNYSYDSTAYPKLAARWNNNTYHAVNKEVPAIPKSVAYQPSLQPLTVFYANNPNLTLTGTTGSGNNRKAWQAIRTSSTYLWDATAIINPVTTTSEDWEADENYLQKVTTSDGMSEVLKLTPTLRTGFSFIDGVVIESDDPTTRALTATVVHFSTTSKKTITLVSCIWNNSGQNSYAVKVDVANNKVYYGGRLEEMPGHNPVWTEVQQEFNFIKDDNGWYDVNIPLGIVLGSINNVNRMYTLLFYPDTNASANTYYLDNIYLYTAYRSLNECKEQLLVEITEAQKLLDMSEYSIFTEELTAAITAAQNVYDNSTSVTEVVNACTTISGVTTNCKEVIAARNELTATIAEANEMADSGKYAEEAVAELRTQIAIAESVLENYPKSKDDITTANKVLRAKMTSLIDEVPLQFTSVKSTQEVVEKVAFSTANYASSVYYGATATSSSAIAAGASASAAIDNSSGSRWESVHGSDPQWIKVDLGSIKTITEIGIRWEGAHAKDFAIRYSTDDEEWVSLGKSTYTEGIAEIDYIHKLTSAVSARYVMIFCHTRCSVYGDSIYSLYIANDNTDDYNKLFYDTVITPAFDNNSRVSGLSVMTYTDTRAYNLYATLGDVGQPYLNGQNITGFEGSGFIDIPVTKDQKTSGSFTTVASYIPVNVNYLYISLNNTSTKTWNSDYSQYSYTNAAFIYRFEAKAGKKYWINFRDIAFSGFVPGIKTGYGAGIFGASVMPAEKAGKATTKIIARNTDTGSTSTKLNHSLTCSASENTAVAMGPVKYDPPVSGYSTYTEFTFVDGTVLTTDFNDSNYNSSTTGYDLVMGYGLKEIKEVDDIG